MTSTHIENPHGTARLPQEGVAWRLVRIKRDQNEIEKAWVEQNIPGSPACTELPGGRGVELSVELPDEDDNDVDHRLSPYEEDPGGSGSSQRCARSRRGSKQAKSQLCSDNRPARVEGDTMKAVCWRGKKEVAVESVPDPTILNPRDAIVRITSTAICGSDLHLYNGRVPTMETGDILGHEFMGEVVEVGKGVGNLRIGDRVVVPFPIACGHCYPCSKGMVTLCENSNPGRRALELMVGEAGAGIFGYSALYGSYAGGQAEYARVPFADFGPLKVPEGLDDEQALFLSDIIPTGYQAAEYAQIEPGDTVAVWGCGPVGQWAIRSCFLFGAARVIAIDRHSARLRLAEEAGAETLNYEDTDDLVELLKQLTAGAGPDRCIDAVGMEAHGTSIYGKIERGKQALKLQMDNATVLRQIIQSCAGGGTASIAGVYVGMIDKFPYGAAFAKGLTIKGGQCNVHRYMKPLLEKIMNGELNPPEIISHRAPLDDAPAMYDLFEQEKDDCTKVVLKT